MATIYSGDEPDQLIGPQHSKAWIDELVFSNAKGHAINQSVLSHNFASIAKKCGFEGIGFHDLRHTFASLMLMKGAAPKVISETLGHSSVAFTMDVYSHIIKGMQEDAIALLDEVLPVDKNGAFQNNNAKLTPNLQTIANNN
ncbi:tyrosine-type recombinase/integrase [Chloroflexota bacterium]